MDNTPFTLHRKGPGRKEDRMVDGPGSKQQMLLRYLDLPRSQRPKYEMMQGGTVLSHLEINALAREEGLLD
jgi:hypothetical protein